MHAHSTLTHVCPWSSCILSPTPFRSALPGVLLWRTDHSHVWHVWMDGECTIQTKPMNHRATLLSVHTMSGFLHSKFDVMPQSNMLSLLDTKGVDISLHACSLLLPPLQYIYAAPSQVDVVKGVFIPWCQNCTQGAVKQVGTLTLCLAYIPPMVHSYLLSQLVLDTKLVSVYQTYPVVVHTCTCTYMLASYPGFLIPVFVTC